VYVYTYAYVYVHICVCEYATSSAAPSVPTSSPVYV